MTAWYFHYQQHSKESVWTMAMADQRQAVLERMPAFVTVLDLTAIPEDNDWSKVRYRGPLYFDFDADGDLPLVIAQTFAFLGKLQDEYDFDVQQAKVWASGGKGFHIEIPMECFLPKVSVNGYAWLPYVYKQMAQTAVVDTLDLSVYSAKKGRMWRTNGVRRESGQYKVPVRFEDLLGMTEEGYRELCSVPREDVHVNVPTLHTKLALLFDQANEKVKGLVKNKKRKAEVANKALDPWKKAKQHMPTLRSIMNGDNVKHGVGFNKIAMQLAIYAVSMGTPLDEFLIMCQGLCQNHESDNTRYGNARLRQLELQRMYEYMENQTLYDFDPAPILAMLAPGVPAPDLGAVDTADEAVGEAATQITEGSTVEEIADSLMNNTLRTIRRGFFMNGSGMFRQVGDKVETVCRALFTHITKTISIRQEEGNQDGEFIGYEANLVTPPNGEFKTQINTDMLISLPLMRRYFAAHALSFQGLDADVTALFDIMNERATNQVFTMPREGVQVIDNPVVKGKREPVLVYVTKSGFFPSIHATGDKAFVLKYAPRSVTSQYNIDIHLAGRMTDQHAAVYDHLFKFNKTSVVADLLGWFVACHFRAVYQRFFNQFPLLQAYGESGAGKTATVQMLAKLHWYMTKPPLNSAMGLTPFALETIASTSTSAPMILDEYKVRDLAKAGMNKLPKIRDLMKASYTGGQIANKGTLNKGDTGGATVVRLDATAPIVFMTEAIEMETAIIERCVPVNFSKNNHTQQRQDSFNVLLFDEEAISALGREIIEYALFMNLDEFRDDMKDELKHQESMMPAFGSTQKRDGQRVLFNRAVVIHSLKILERVLKARFGIRYNEAFEELLADDNRADERTTLRSHAMSEISKVMNRMAAMTYDEGEGHELRMGIDYAVLKTTLDVKVETCFDRYRLWCVRLHETPLFDSVEAFKVALSNYGPTLQVNTPRSPLRDAGSTSQIASFDLVKLQREGINNFRP